MKPTETTSGLPSSADVVVVGGGFAGAAVACFLCRKGLTDVLVLEAESQFGQHASGLNAAMARQVTADPLTNEILSRSLSLLTAAGDDWPDTVDLRPGGSLLLTAKGRGDGLLSAARTAAEKGLDCRVLDREGAMAMVPVLDPRAFDRAVYTASDGVVDIHGLLWRFLKTARKGGARLVTSCRMTGVESRDGRVTAVTTDRGRVTCRVLVNAAGAWGNRLAALVGLDPLAMTPYRRHLVTTPPLEVTDPGWPFVWDTTHDFYFRPEVGGLLLTPGDESPMEPGDTPRDPAVLEILADKLARYCPELSGIPVARYWAGLRTITRDSRFAVGWDGRMEGLFWVAGLGGHGMTASSAVGEFSADRILGNPVNESWKKGLAPSRLC